MYVQDPSESSLLIQLLLPFLLDTAATEKSWVSNRNVITVGKHTERSCMFPRAYERKCFWNAWKL